MKKLISIFLVGAILLPSIGTWLWFKQQQYSLRREVKNSLMAQLNDKDLSLLVFSEEDLTLQLRWKHEKEFEYQGVMYDIVKRKFEDGKHYLWCWKDDKETRLNKKFEALLTKAYEKDSQNNPGHQFLQQLFYPLFFESPENWTLLTLTEETSKITFGYQREYHSVALPPISPPPIFA